MKHLTKFNILLLACLHALSGTLLAQYLDSPLTPIMTSNTTPAPFTIKTTSEYSASEGQGFHAFNRSPDSGWVTAPGSFTGLNYTGSQSITIYLGGPNTLGYYVFYSRSTGSAVDCNQYPRDWQVLVSNDGINFEVVDTRTNVAQPANLGDGYVYPLKTEKSCSYVRITITRARRDLTAIGEIFLCTSRIQPDMPDDDDSDDTWLPGSNLDNLIPDGKGGGGGGKGGKGGGRSESDPKAGSGGNTGSGAGNGGGSDNRASGNSGGESYPADKDRTTNNQPGKKSGPKKIRSYVDPKTGYVVDVYDDGSETVNLPPFNVAGGANDEWPNDYSGLPDSDNTGNNNNNADGTGTEGTDNNTSDGCNPFNLQGNVTRKITDLSMTGSDPLQWIRYNNSIPRTILPAFGLGASWRHNWQYELQARTDDTGDHLFFIYPSGIRRTFDRQADGSFATLHQRYEEKARLVGDNVEITTQDENTLVFEPISAPAAQATAGVYRPVTLTDKNGQITRFDYDDNNLLQHITNEAGNQITLSYEKKSGISCISRVETSDGRAVDYEYKNKASVGVALANARSTQKYPTLALARYGDGTSAEYKYDFVTPGLAPLLVEANDPRYNGRATHIGYRYNNTREYGTIYQEFNPETLQAYATLEFDPSDPEKRTVNYTDDRTITYRVPEGTNNRPTERTDSLGRTQTWIYANGGAESLVDKTNVDGSSTKYTRNKKGEITRISHNDGLVIDIELDKNGKVAKTSDNRGHSAEYVRDSKGRVTQLTKTNSGNGNNGNPNPGQGNPHGTPPGQAKKEAFVYDDAGRLLRQDYPDGTYEEFTRGKKGNITTKRDRNGRVSHYTYAKRGLVASATDPAGETTNYTYDSYGQRASATDALGHVTTWERNERGLVTKQTNPDGTTHLYSYDQYGHKTGETDELGRSAAWEYDNLGHLTLYADFAGGVTRYDYTETPGGCGTCSLVSNPTRITRPDGRIDEFLYDSEGRLLMQALAVGTAQMATTLYAYDNADNLIQQTNPDGGVTRNTYDINKRRLSSTDPLGRTTTWTYDVDGKVLSVTGPSGRTIDNAYDADNNLVYAVTSGGAESIFEYDAAKRRTSATDALGNTTRWNYNDAGDLVSAIDATGGTTTYTYDSLGRRTHVKLPDGTSQTWAYNSIGQVTQTTTPDGLEVNNEYDDMGRTLATTSTPSTSGRGAGVRGSEGTTIRTTYDIVGRRTSTTDGLGRTTSYEYNARNQVTTTTYPDGTTTQNDYDDTTGRLAATTDQLGHTTGYTYTAMGDMASLTDANGNTTTFDYDAMRHKTAMTYPDGTAERWTYDLLGRIATYTTRASQTKTITYNLDGKKLTETWSPAGCAPDVFYTYDDTTGRLLTADNGNTVLAYTYDKLGRVLTETTTINPLSNPNLNLNLNLNPLPPHTVSYQYDALGRKSALTYPDGTKVTYIYDAQDRLTEVYNGSKKPLATYDYDAYGRRSKLTRDNGVVTTYAYDSASQTLSVNHLDKSNKALAFATYEYDNMGRRTTMTRENLQTDNYTYDATGQLTDVDYTIVEEPASGNNGNGKGNNGKGSAGVSPADASRPAMLPLSESLTYDPLGNRQDHTTIAQDNTPELEQYETNELNQYTSVSAAPSPRSSTDPLPEVEGNNPDGSSDNSPLPLGEGQGEGMRAYAYDPNGNLTADPTQHYTYDAQNRLISVESPTTRAVFTYDAKNRCILRQYYTADANGVWFPDDANSVVMTYDTGWNILTDRNLTGRQTAAYIHGTRTDEILAQTRDSGQYYPLADASNNTIALIDQNGSKVGTWQYTAFGKAYNVSGAVTDYRYLFTGREWLAPVGLQDNRNRCYNPSTGRWLSRDSIYFSDGANLYAYGHNDPIDLSDPFGTICYGITQLSNYYASKPGWCMLASVLNMIPPGQRPSVDDLVAQIASNLNISVQDLIAKLDHVDPNTILSDGTLKPDGGLLEKDVKNGVIPALDQLGIDTKSMRTADITTNPSSSENSQNFFNQYMALNIPIVMTYTDKTNYNPFTNDPQYTYTHSVTIMGDGKGGVTIIDPADSSPSPQPHDLQYAYDLYKNSYTNGGSAYLLVPGDAPRPTYSEGLGP